MKLTLQGDESQNVKKIIAGIVIVLLIGGASWYMWGRTDVHDNGDRANAVTEQLSTARDAEQSAANSIEGISRGLHDTQATADRLAESNSNSQATANRIADSISASYGTAKDSAELIRQCQQIVQTVRQRGATGEK